VSQIVSDPPHLFVYGTLRRGARSAWSRFLPPVSTFVGMGRTRGVLFQLGGYPGMTPGSGEEAWVRGEVCLLHNPRSVLPVLDDYEGCGTRDPPPHEYRRQVVDVLLDDGRTVQAWAYIYLLDTADKTRIVSGDYLGPARPSSKGYRGGRRLA